MARGSQPGGRHRRRARRTADAGRRKERSATPSEPAVRLVASGDAGGAASPTQPQTASAVADDGLTGQIWEQHVFICTSGKYCPAVDGDGLGVHARFKQLVAEAGLKQRVRVNHSGCMDQCGHGPMVVVYPEGVWYSGVQPDDVDEIVREHLVGGRPVARLVYRARPGKNKLPRDEQNRAIGRPSRP